MSLLLNIMLVPNTAMLMPSPDDHVYRMLVGTVIDKSLKEYSSREQIFKSSSKKLHPIIIPTVSMASLVPLDGKLTPGSIREAQIDQGY